MLMWHYINEVRDDKSSIGAERVSSPHYKLSTLAQHQENVARDTIWLRKVHVATISRALRMVAIKHVAKKYCHQC